GDDRVERGLESILRGNLQEVRRAHLSVRGLVAEDALLGFSRQHRVGLVLGPRKVGSFVVDEEEQLVLQRTERQRSTEIAAEIVLPQLRLRQAARVVEKRIRPEAFMLKLLEAAPVILVGASLRDELERDGAFRARIGAEPGGLDRDFFHRAQTRRDRGVKTRTAALESVRG